MYYSILRYFLGKGHFLDSPLPATFSANLAHEGTKNGGVFPFFVDHRLHRFLRFYFSIIRYFEFSIKINLRVIRLIRVICDPLNTKKEKNPAVLPFGHYHITFGRCFPAEWANNDYLKSLTGSTHKQTNAGLFPFSACKVTKNNAHYKFLSPQIRSFCPKTT